MCIRDSGTKDEEMVLKVGDTVLYGKYAGTELEVEGTKYPVSYTHLISTRDDSVSISIAAALFT